MIKLIRDRAGVLSLAALVFVSLTLPASGDELPILRHFNVRGTQYTLLAKSFWERFQESAGFNSCVRRFYSKVELLDRPLQGQAFDILQFFKKSMTAENRNSFDFLNSGSEPWKCKLIGGYCMGVTALNRDFNLLLVFDPNESFAKLPKFASDQEKSDFYEEILWDVWVHKKPAFIPGFADLNALSADPIIRNIFHGAVPKNWGDLATIPEIALGVLSKSRKRIPEGEMLDEIAFIKQAKEKGYNPVIHIGGVKKPRPVSQSRSLHMEGVANEQPTTTFDRAMSEEEVRQAMASGDPNRVSMAESRSIPGAISGALDPDSTWIHVVQVTKIEEVGPRKWVLTAIDPNGHAPRNIATITVDLDAEVVIHFKGSSAEMNLNSFGQLPGDREHMDEIVANLNLFAKKYPGVFTAPETPKKLPKKRRKP